MKKLIATAMLAMLATNGLVFAEYTGNTGNTGDTGYTGDKNCTYEGKDYSQEAPEDHDKWVYVSHWEDFGSEVETPKGDDVGMYAGDNCYPGSRN